MFMTIKFLVLRFKYPFFILLFRMCGKEEKSKCGNIVCKISFSIGKFGKTTKSFMVMLVSKAFLSSCMMYSHVEIYFFLLHTFTDYIFWCIEELQICSIEWVFTAHNAQCCRYFEITSMSSIHIHFPSIDSWAYEN